MSQRHVNVALFVPHAGCPHRCIFCDQRAISACREPVTAEQVIKACETARHTMSVSANRAEIAFFGGSFTALPPAYRRALLEAAAPYVAQGVFSGIRVSTRPDAIDSAVLRELRDYGVTTVELGAQSMRDTVLCQNGRGHTAAQTELAAAQIRAAGFSLGLQMMTGLYGDTPAGTRETARRLAALHPAAVRIYPTLVLKNTALAAVYAAGHYIPPTLAETVVQCASLLHWFEEKQKIPVIRLGLHAEPSLTENYVAGPWHPALRELCESRRYYTAAKRALKGRAPGPVRLYVAPSALSRMIGQKRSNITALREQGYMVTVVPDPSVLPGTIKTETQEETTEWS